MLSIGGRAVAHSRCPGMGFIGLVERSVIGEVEQLGTVIAESDEAPSLAVDIHTVDHVLVSP